MKVSVNLLWKQLIENTNGSMSQAIRVMKSDITGLNINDQNISKLLSDASCCISPVDKAHKAFDAFRLIAAHVND